MNANYHEISDETWEGLLTEDEGIPYHVVGSGIGTPSHEEIIVDQYDDNTLPEHDTIGSGSDSNGGNE